MAVQGGAKCIKYLMFFFNFIFFVLGVGIIVAGGLTLTVYKEYVAFTGTTGTAIPIILICVGVLIFMTGFFGCCGAVKENYCMLGSYSFIMVVLLIIELAAGISGYVLRDDIEKIIDTNMSQLQEEYNTTAVTKKLFDSMQQDLKCCGVDNYTDWQGFDDANLNLVPASCCLQYTASNDSAPAGCNLIGDSRQSIYTDSCYTSLKDLLGNNIAIIAGIAIGIAVVEIFGIVFACCLMKSIKSEYEVV